MSNDYERLSETGEAFIYVAMSRLMARDWPAREAVGTVTERGFSEVRDLCSMMGRSDNNEGVQCTTCAREP